jgi:hypothetical protein
MPSQTHRTLSVRVPASEADATEAYAARRGEFVSDTLRRALQRELGTDSFRNCR